MKRFTELFLYLFVTVFIGLSVSTAAQPDVKIKDNSLRHALVIGNGAYISAPLKNPVNDALDMSKSLKSLGFRIIEEINANRKAMEDADHKRAKNTFSRGKGRSQHDAVIKVYGLGYMVEGKPHFFRVGVGLHLLLRQQVLAQPRLRHPADLRGAFPKMMIDGLVI